MVYAIGDIHGCLNHLINLLNLVNPDLHRISWFLLGTIWTAALSLQRLWILLLT